MNFAMLWYDDDKKRTFEMKVGRAAEYHNQKYRRVANCCHVHPTMLPPGVEKIGDVVIVADKVIMVNCFWIGVAEEQPESPKPEVGRDVKDD